MLPFWEHIERLSFIQSPIDEFVIDSPLFCASPDLRSEAYFFVPALTRFARIL